MNTLVVDDSDVSPAELDALQECLVEALGRRGYQGAVRVQHLKVDHSQFAFVDERLRRGDIDCVLVDGFLRRTPTDGLEFLRRIRCSVGFDGFTRLWSSHSEDFIKDEFISQAQWLFQAPAGGAWSSTGAEARSRIAADLADAWHGNGRSFRVSLDAMPCIDLEGAVFETLNLLQLMLWSDRGVRCDYVLQVQRRMSADKGLLNALKQRSATKEWAVEVERCVAEIAKVTHEEEQCLALLSDARDLLLSCLRRSRTSEDG